MARNLIIYYSRRGQNYIDGEIRDIEKGNTEYCVEFIQKAVGADVFRVETVEAYPEDYTACTMAAQAELQSGRRPALKKQLSSVSGYDNIFVCGPCWWGTFPCALLGQLEWLDWTGRDVYPLMTHEGSGLGQCESDLARICKGASIGAGLAVRGGMAAQSESVVAAWAKKCL